MAEFTDLHREVLIFEATWRPTDRSALKRREAVRERFDVTFGVYQRLLSEACSHPEALNVAPSVVRRRSNTRRK